MNQSNIYTHEPCWEKLGIWFRESDPNVRVACRTMVMVLLIVFIALYLPPQIFLHSDETGYSTSLEWTAKFYPAMDNLRRILLFVIPYLLLGLFIGLTALQFHKSPQSLHILAGYLNWVVYVPVLACIVLYIGYGVLGCIEYPLPYIPIIIGLMILLVSGGWRAARFLQHQRNQLETSEHVRPSYLETWFSGAGLTFIIWVMISMAIK